MDGEYSNIENNSGTESFGDDGGGDSKRFIPVIDEYSSWNASLGYG